MPHDDTSHDNAPDWAELRAWVAGLDRGTRERGAQYADENRVKLLLVESDAIIGVVAGTEAMPYRTTLRRQARSGLWVASCDCPVGVSCKHAVAVALTALRAAPNESVPEGAPGEDAGGSKDFVQGACETLGRDLTRKETLALSNIAAACSVKSGGRPVRASIEAALHAVVGNDYATLNRLPAELEASVGSPDLLLAAMAAALGAAGKPIPAWMSYLVSRSGAADTLERERSERVVREWRAALGGLSRAEPAPATETPVRALRLRRAATWVFQWEARDTPGAVWRPLAADLRDRLLASAIEPESIFAPESVKVAELFRRFARSACRDIAFDARALPPGKSFGELLAHPAMAGHLTDAEGAPLSRRPGRLVWAFAPSPGKPGHARPVLATEDGAPPPAGARPVGAGLFLSEGGLHAGPPPLGRYDGRGAPPDIPVAVFDDPAVRASLRAAGAVVPESFAATSVAVSPLLTVSLTPADETGELLLAKATLSGEDSLRRIRATLTENRWEVSPVAGEPATAVPDTDKLQDAVRHYYTGPRFAGDDGCQVLTEGNVGSFADWLSAFPRGTRFDLPETLVALTRPPDRAVIGAEIHADREGADWFDLKLVLRPEDAELSKAELKLLLAHGGRWVNLEGKGWRRMETAASASADAALQALGLDPARLALGDTFRYHAAQLAGDKAASLFDAVSAKKLRECSARLASLPTPSLPPGLHATLRPYQSEGFHFLAHLASNGLGGVLADDMGLGKTLQTITWLLWLKAGQGEGRSRFLVVAPKSVVPNWVAEVAKFAPGLSVATLGEDSARVCAKADLVVANYTRLRLATEEFLEAEWGAVVLDEGQHIKNPTSQIAETVRALKAKHRLVLSGTPVENRLLDLWSLFSFVMPGLLGTQASFKRQYDEKKDKGAASRLAARVRPFLLRRTKAQVAGDLPERVEEDLVVELEPAQRKLYDAELKKARALLLSAKSSREFDRSRFSILTSLLRLRQICCDPRLVSPKAKPADSAKLDALWELVEPLVAEGHKVLVFSQFTEALDLVGQKLTEEKVGHLKLTGATENRAELVSCFQKSDTEKVFLLSLKAAGTGLNLTAASYVVLFDPWWNPAAEAQAIDRTHRIGQKNKVIAYRFIAKNTVEQKIRALQRDKAALAGEILQEESLPKVLDLDTLRGILAE